MTNNDIHITLSNLESNFNEYVRFLTVISWYENILACVIGNVDFIV